MVQPAPCTCSLHAEVVGSPVAKTGSIFPVLPRGGGWGLWDLILFFFFLIYLAARGLSLCHVGPNPRPGMEARAPAMEVQSH